MPSVLIELGYLTNLKEERELGSAEVQDYLASAIYRAIRDYINYLESTR
jgi:N-acetylmuramoyl-L-alanine amidase